MGVREDVSCDFSLSVSFMKVSLGGSVAWFGLLRKLSVQDGALLVSVIETGADTRRMNSSNK